MRAWEQSGASSCVAHGQEAKPCLSDLRPQTSGPLSSPRAPFPGFPSIMHAPAMAPCVRTPPPSLIKHAHTAQEVFLTPSHVCMAMEYAKGGDLYNYVKAMGCLKEATSRCVRGRLRAVGRAGR